MRSCDQRVKTLLSRVFDAKLPLQLGVFGRNCTLLGDF